MLNDFPFQALGEAAKLGEYTLTDYGTWCAVDSDVRDKLKIFVGFPRLTHIVSMFN